MKKITVCCLAALLSFSFASSEAFACASSEVSALAAKPKKEYATVVFHVHLHCADCVKKVKENIAFEKGVKDLKVSLEEHTVTVTYDPKKTDEARLKAAIEKLGYEVHGKK